ncbi:MAG: acetate--CoA ligase [Gemmatimonadetes bacterium]|nr:acetate--CoA ligase [Gemmatimonadota bacterium]
MTEIALDSLLDERRLFPPPSDFAHRAVVNDPAIYERASEDIEAFWADWASRLDWFRPWDSVLEWNPPQARWFLGGKLNAAWNCLDRHLSGPVADRPAIHWEGEPGDRRVLTYRELHREVSIFANVLKRLDVGKGDRVTIYLPMIPEAAVAMLACARIGAIHSVVFGGFSARSLADRNNDAGARLLVTADGGWRRGSIVPLKRNADEALARSSTLENVLVVRRGGELSERVNAEMVAGRDHWYHELRDTVSDDCPAEPMDAEDTLFILYTSGTTGKPKGVVHTTGGYMTQLVATTTSVFGPKEEDVYWCTADVGWITGHSYIVYGPLACGAQVLIYEGAPDAPDRSRFWRICEEYEVTVFYTAPTAIRAFMRWGESHPAAHDLSRLRLLGTVGEPINPEAWSWYHRVIGGERCPIVDTWWQTETGAMMITPLPAITAARPGSAARAFPGIEVKILDDAGEECDAGYLAITAPWPSMLRTVWGDDERYRDTYWSKWPDIYFTGDGARRDEDGYLWILGRVDDVLNVAGHRIGTMEVESALVDHETVAEAAVVGKSHDVKGESIAAFVTLKEGVPATPDLNAELRVHVGEQIGPIARPELVVFAADLPKTRSGKIMRRLLRDVAEGRALGDTSTLADPSVVARLKEVYEDEE